MDKESASPDGRPAVAVLTLTRRQVALVLLLFIASLLAVGLLAGLVRPARPSLAVRKPASPTSGGAEPWLNPRLPTHILPVHYELTLYPDFYQPDQQVLPPSSPLPFGRAGCSVAEWLACWTRAQ